MAPSPTCKTFSIASKAEKSRTLRSKPASRRPAPDKSQILHINAAGKSPGRRNPEPERGKGAESVFQGSDAAPMGGSGWWFGELFEDRVEEPFPRNANILGAPNFLFVSFADFCELSSHRSNAERWPKLLAANLCVLCYFVSRDALKIESSTNRVLR